jgi:hypothetical protein
MPPVIHGISPLIDAMKYWLVVEPYPYEKYEFISLDYYMIVIPNIWKK